IGRASEIHLWKNGRATHAAIEKSKKWKGRDVDRPGFDLILPLNLHDLLVEVSMTIKDSLRWTGAAGRENNCRRILAACVHFERFIRTTLPQLIQC
ncbi:MAG: hypothetical protein VB853_03680, partial [Pirellulales bacterium]